MNHSLPQNYFSRIMRAIVEFELIDEGDNILVGLSGGKDSLFLTYALSVLRQYMPHKYELAAFTLDPMFTNNFDTARLETYCNEMNIPFFTEKVDIAGMIKQNKGKDPCFTCAFFRRGAINRFARQNGFNKIAYAHHHDDAVETFFMSLLYSGQLKTFMPKTYLSRTKLTVIRPLIYFREYELKTTPQIHGLTPLPSPCPLNGTTKRQEIKELICDLGKKDPAVYEHLGAAMRTSSIQELWPPILPRQEMQAKHRRFWKSKE